MSHAYPPIGLKPRYLTTGTGISLPSTSAPPYPTGTASGTAISTGSTANSTATPTQIPPTELFYLVVADSGTDFDGNYIQFSGDTSQSGGITLYPRPPPVTPFPSLLFNINVDGTLGIQEYICFILNIETYSSIILDPPGNDFPINPYNPLSTVYCEVVGGNLACHADSSTVFSMCPDDFPYDDFTGNLDLGPNVEPGCVEVTLRVVPL